MKQINLLKEIPESDMGMLEERIYNFISSRVFTTFKTHGDALGYCSTFDGYDKKLGFAYTSTSSFAGLWICNDTLFLDCEQGVRILGFAMTSAHMAVAVCETEDEDMFYIYI